MVVSILGGKICVEKINSFLFKSETNTRYLSCPFFLNYCKSLRYLGSKSGFILKNINCQRNMASLLLKNFSRRLLVSSRKTKLKGAQISSWYATISQYTLLTRFFVVLILVKRSSKRQWRPLSVMCSVGTLSTCIRCQMFYFCSENDHMECG
jgi:hypothetical protein